MRLFYSPRGDLSGSKAVYSLLDRAFFLLYGKPLPEIEKTPNGKPFFPHNPDIHFSLSHSKTHVLCALSRSPVGADIESPRVLNERLIRRFCSSDELLCFDPLDLWVLKESMIKLSGSTLSDIKKLRFTRADGIITAPEPKVISRLYGVDNCRAAVCSFLQPPPDVIELL